MLINTKFNTETINSLFNFTLCLQASEINFENTNLAFKSGRSCYVMMPLKLVYFEQQVTTAVDAFAVNATDSDSGLALAVAGVLIDPMN